MIWIICLKTVLFSQGSALTVKLKRTQLIVYYRNSLFWTVWWLVWTYDKLIWDKFTCLRNWIFCLNVIWRIDLLILPTWITLLWELFWNLIVKKLLLLMSLPFLLLILLLRNKHTLSIFINLIRWIKVNIFLIWTLNKLLLLKKLIVTIVVSS